MINQGLSPWSARVDVPNRRLNVKLVGHGNRNHCCMGRLRSLDRFPGTRSCVKCGLIGDEAGYLPPWVFGLARFWLNASTSPTQTLSERWARRRVRSAEIWAGRLPRPQQGDTSTPWETPEHDQPSGATRRWPGAQDRGSIARPHLPRLQRSAACGTAHSPPLVLSDNSTTAVKTNCGVVANLAPPSPQRGTLVVDNV
jgi:hypothetical protein